MKRWLKRTLFGLFGATVLFGSLAGCSHRMEHHGWGSGPASEADRAEWRAKMVDRVAGRLDLDAAQKAKLAVLADTMAKQRQAVVGTTNPRDEMKAVIAGERFDRARAQALVDGRTGALREASPAVIAAAADFYDALKPEQQAKVREFLDRGGRRHGWRG